MKTKVENDLAAFMRSIAAKRGRNIEVAESAVRESKSFTEQEALNQHLDRLRRVHRGGPLQADCRASPFTGLTDRRSR